MRLLSFQHSAEGSTWLWGALLPGELALVPLSKEDALPSDLITFLASPGTYLEAARRILASPSPAQVIQLDQVTLLPPLPRPTSLRDFYAFEQHVVTANANRGRQVPPEWYEIPVFYFSNPFSGYGHNMNVPRPSYTLEMDYELEVAAVIGRAGRDIQPANAMNHIAGFMIFNDWSARDVQRQEMKVGLGPAKGKDFASSFGPWLVTPDELEPFSTDRPGVYDLLMTARKNGLETARGNWKDIHYDFGQMLARASAAVSLYPGDIIGSGTVGTGCLLETTKGEGPWLQPGDVVELEIEQLGLLTNTITS